MALSEKTRIGRPPKYTSVKEIEEKIETYFENCKGRVLMVDGEVVTNKYGDPIIVDSHPPTVTGLALALGFESRQGLLNYQAKKEYSAVITRAKSRIEAYVEERLFDKDGANGAKFSLQNNFRGWNEASKEAAMQATAAAVKIICDIPRDAVPPKPAETESSPESGHADSE